MSTILAQPSRATTYRRSTASNAGAMMAKARTVSSEGSSALPLSLHRCSTVLKAVSVIPAASCGYRSVSGASSPAAADAGTGRRVWELSEQLTDVRFVFPTLV
ncbi:hypothetical protein GCM10010319_60710 [Streptomyces blastmyceticus]|uniref:Uncharacterized protein n=1 Tax=Streptomyces blastmyceticus TaxID=68180 RepID=A0ABN0XVI9_9ACTN